MLSLSQWKAGGLCMFGHHMGIKHPVAESAITHDDAASQPFLLDGSRDPEAASVQIWLMVGRANGAIEPFK